MSLQLSSHIGEDTLELYALGRLAEDESVSVEEHILLCHPCQDRLSELDDFIRAFRVAAPRVETARPGPWTAFWGNFGTNFRPMYGAGALAAAVLAVVFLIPRQARIVGTADLTLTATRGELAGGLVNAPANHTLNLTLDATGLPEAPYYLIEFTSSAGKSLFTATLAAKDNQIHFTTGQAFHPGRHWIRIHTQDHTRLLREFGLVVK